ncbi:MAG TPA: hypothetical protein VGM19_14010 [Armatimonadota bacterium]|jgi:hypothetical protein
MSLTPLERKQIRATQEFLGACSQRWYVDTPRLGLTVGVRPEADHLCVCLHLTRLGEEYPGGWDVLREVSLWFEPEAGGPAIEAPLVTGSPEARISGETAFRRLRGTRMFPYGMVHRLAVPKGTYQLRLKGDIVRGEPLSLMCDAYDYFADSLVRALESHDEFHREKAPYGYSCRVPLVEPLDLLVGSYANEADLLAPPAVYWVNEIAALPADWARADRQPLPAFTPPASAEDALAPQNYFREPLLSGLKTFAERGYCRYATHVSPGPVTQSGGVYFLDRATGWWCILASKMYRLTGDPVCARAAHAAGGALLDNLPSAPADSSQLHLGLMTHGLLEYAAFLGDNAPLEPVLAVWDAWPIESDGFPAGMPTRTGGDMMRNHTFNMILELAAPLWEACDRMGAIELREKAARAVRLVLRGMRPEGYWYYRGYGDFPEGLPDPARGGQHNYHYDNFVKMMLGWLVRYPEWREFDGFLSQVRQAVDFSLAHPRSATERALRIGEPDLYGKDLTPVQDLAESLCRSGFLLSALGPLAAGEGGEQYLGPLTRMLQWAYDQRHEPLLADYWDNSWMVNVYGGWLDLALQGYRFSGTPEALVVAPPA